MNVAAPAIDGALRQALSEEVAPDAISWLLWRWQRAAQGNDAEQAEIERVVSVAGVKPREPSATAVTQARRVEEAWLRAPNDVRAARAWWRASAAEGTPAPARDPGLLTRTLDEAPTMTEAAFVVLVDAAAVAAADVVSVEDAAERLRVVEAMFGRVGEPLVDADFAHRENVLARLLGAAASAPSAATVDAARQAEGRSLMARLRRIFVGLLVAAAFSAIVAALPKALPALPRDELLRPGEGAQACAGCAPAERITGFGWVVADNRARVTIEVGATPVVTDLQVLLGPGGDMVVARRIASGWQLGALGASLRPERVQVLDKGRVVVVELPRDAVSNRLAVATSAGDRLPVVGFAPPTERPQPAPNVIDVVVVLLLLLAAVRGYRAGLIATAPTLAGFLLTILGARLLYRPLGALVLGRLTELPRLANSIAVGVVTAVVGAALYLVGGAFTRRVTRRATGLPLAKSAPDRWLGAAARASRATALVATTLTLFVNLAMVTWVAGAVRTSAIGAATVKVWRTVYPGL